MNKKKPFFLKGFTVVEVLTTIAIITLISSGLVISNARFGADFSLTNLAYDMAETLRELQTFGLSTKNWKTSITTLGEGFDAGYGIRFASNDSGTISGEKKFLTFYDKLSPIDGTYNSRCGFNENDLTNPNAKLPNNLYNCKQESEFSKEYFIGGKNKVYKICAIYGGGEDCYNFETKSGIEYLDIVFMRSGPGQGVSESDVRISTNLKFYPSINNYSSARITVKNQSGFTKDVVISLIGQISVE